MIAMIKIPLHLKVLVKAYSDEKQYINFNGGNKYEILQKRT